MPLLRPTKRLTCKLPPPPAPPPGPFRLFIRFPSEVDDHEDTRVHSLTIESDSVAVTAIKAHTELMLGLPADCYELRYGEKRLKDTDRLRIGRDVYDGSLLIACPYQRQTQCIAEAVYHEDASKLQDLCGFTCIRDQRSVPRKVKPSEDCRPPRSLGDGCYDYAHGRDDTTGICLVVDTEIAFIAMCIAAACGYHELVEIIGNADGDGSIRKLATPFGRTPLHIACANDHDRVVNLLLAFHYNPLAKDVAQQTPITVAGRFEAGLSTLLIRRHQEKCKRKQQKDAAASRFNVEDWFEQATAKR